MSGSYDFSSENMRVVGIARVIGDLSRARRRLHDRLGETMADEGEQLAEVARARIAELFKNPAQMQAAIQTRSGEELSRSGGLSEVVIYAAGLPYLRIHEYGGVIQTPEIFPRNVKALHWFDTGFAEFREGSYSLADEIFAKRTRPHPTPIPERSYLRYALAQRREAIREAFHTAVTESLTP